MKPISKTKPSIVFDEKTKRVFDLDRCRLVKEDESDIFSKGKSKDVTFQTIDGSIITVDCTGREELKKSLESRLKHHQTWDNVIKFIEARNFENDRFMTIGYLKELSIGEQKVFRDCYLCEKFSQEAFFCGQCPLKQISGGICCPEDNSPFGILGKILVGRKFLSAEQIRVLGFSDKKVVKRIYGKIQGYEIKPSVLKERAVALAKMIRDAYSLAEEKRLFVYDEREDMWFETKHFAGVDFKYYYDFHNFDNMDMIIGHKRMWYKVLDYINNNMEKVKQGLLGTMDIQTIKDLVCSGYERQLRGRCYFCQDQFHAVDLDHYVPCGNCPLYKATGISCRDDGSPYDNCSRTRDFHEFKRSAEVIFMIPEIIHGKASLLYDEKSRRFTVDWDNYDGDRK